MEEGIPRSDRRPTKKVYMNSGMGHYMRISDSDVVLVIL